MAKFLNKKQQVYDLKLTSYGHYLFSIGKFKPTYYAFFDHTVLYDFDYTHQASGTLPGPMSQSSETQNQRRGRIKDSTSYLETLTLFQEVETLTTITEEAVNYEVDLTPTQVTPRKDIFKYAQSIGDSYLSAENSQFAPAWKIVALNGQFESCQYESSGSIDKIPQINIRSRYKKVVHDPSTMIYEELDPSFDPRDPADLNNRTTSFKDGAIIRLIADNPLVYIEEHNTELLSKNVEMEVFERIIDQPLTYATGSITFLQNTNYTTPPQQIIIRPSDLDSDMIFQFKDSTNYDPAVATDVLIQGDTLTTMAEFVRRVNATQLRVTASLRFADGASLPDNTLDIFNMQGGELGNASSNAAIIKVNAHTVFDIEDFSGGKNLETSLKRKYFPKQQMKVVDGYLQPENVAIAERTVTTASIEQYFIVEADADIRPEEACKGAEMFNKQSYYVNLDYDCEDRSNLPENIYLDIYGPITDSEICPD
tara:strand:- start:9215 stop:10657 length:1443 start_codon:yes stop_codon:yes gene_type:complete